MDLDQQELERVRPKTIKRAAAIRSLKDVLSRIPDRRCREGRRHPLVAILMLVAVGMMCGARGQRGIAAWGRELPRKVRRMLGFTRRKSPAHSTIHEVLKRLDVEAFEEALREWAKGLRVATLMLQRAAGHTSATAAKTRFAVRPKLAVECVAMRVARASRPSTGKATATPPRDGGVAWGRRALRTPGAPGGFAAPSR